MGGSDSEIGWNVYLESHVREAKKIKMLSQNPSR